MSVSQNKCKTIPEIKKDHIYTSDAAEAAFPLGGIGTGNVWVGSRGEFRDWEIFNLPGKNNYLPNTFFSLWCKEENQEPICRVLEAKYQNSYSRVNEYCYGMPGKFLGLPRLKASEMLGEYPFCEVRFLDESLPLNIKLEAFTPLIPLDADNSGIPGAVIRYSVENTGKAPVDVTIAGSVTNVLGYKIFGQFRTEQMEYETKNEFRTENNYSGIYMTCPEMGTEDLRYGNMSILCQGDQLTYKTKWLDEGWWDGVHDFWDDFSEDGRLENNPVYGSKPSGEIVKDKVKTGSIGIVEKLAPGETKVFQFILGWYFPNRPKGWYKEDCKSGEIIKNYYATKYADSWEAGLYLDSHLTMLELKSRQFKEALFQSTLPEYVIDAVASNVSILRSTTCFRIEDGTFLSFEGTGDTSGVCIGNCTHVWNYAQALAFLFPELERTMRKVEFLLETDEDGRMDFRTVRVFGLEKLNTIPAADGQLGTIIRLYRDWKLSGEDEFLKQLWPNAKKALDFAFTHWDSDGDCVLDSRQHNTYDIEFYGINSLTNSIFFAALKAASEICEYLGDIESSDYYKTAFEKGSAIVDSQLWNGEYFIQKIDDVDEYKYQYGEGCLSDQLLGQLLAHVAGLGRVLPEEHVKSALDAIYQHNFKKDLHNHNNVQRTYAANDESGLLLCTWPQGGRPRLPFVYCDEIWSGIEYQVAAHMIYEGAVEKGLDLVRAVRERYDGYKRNPWDEIECGHHYIRSMASYSLLNALSGMQADNVNNKLAFKPAINKDCFKTFWCNGKAWGTYSQKINECTGDLEWSVETLYGNIEDTRVEIV